MSKNNCRGSENINFGSSLFLWGFPLPKVKGRAARVQLCNQGGHCWENSPGVKKSWDTPHWEPCRGLEPHLCLPLVLGQATLYACMCPAWYPANPNRDLLKWPPSFTLDLQLYYGLIWWAWGLTWSAELLCFPCPGATGLCPSVRALLLPCRAASFCSLALGLSFLCGLSIHSCCNPSFRSLRICLFIGLSGNLSVETSLGTCCCKSTRRCAGDSMPMESTWRSRVTCCLAFGISLGGSDLK